MAGYVRTEDDRDLACAVLIGYDHRPGLNNSVCKPAQDQLVTLLARGNAGHGR